MYSAAAFLFLFYPLAGCLADIRWGRYKTVVYSVHVIWGSLVAIRGVASKNSLVRPLRSGSNQSTRNAACVYVFQWHLSSCNIL
jgi:muramidase (phage lysozyme)